MTSLVLAGNPDGPHLQKSEPIWKRGVGWSTRQTWVGTSRSIRFHVQNWIALGAEDIALDLSGPEGTATITYAQDAEGNPTPDPTAEVAAAEAETVWELDGNDVVKDLWEHPLVANMSDEQKTEIKKQLKAFDEGTKFTTVFIQTANLPWIALMVKGVRQFTDVQWVIRKTVTVSRTYHSKVSLAGIDQLWDGDKIPGIPKVLLFDIAQITPKAVPSAYLFSWLKKSPKVTRTSTGRFQMSEEWWLDSWSLNVPGIPGLYSKYVP